MEQINMKYKMGLIFICLIVGLFSIATVVAGDVNEDIMSIDNQNNQITTLDVNNVDEIATTDMSELSTNSIGTYTDLSSEIENKNNGETLLLEKDYQYNLTNDENNLKISKSITVDGKGHYIDGNNATSFFTIWGNNVVLKNIIFKNANYNYATLNWMGINGSLINCTFENNLPGSSYAVVSWNSNAVNGTISNCKFINNTNNMGFISFSGNFGTIIDCQFENSTKTAVFYTGNNFTIKNCSFDNVNGTFFSISGSDGKISDLNLERNVASAIMISGSNILITDCQFMNNIQEFINFYRGQNLTISNSIFRNNKRPISSNSYMNVINCTFENHTAYSVLSGYNSNIQIIGNVFINNNVTNVVRYNGDNILIKNNTFSDNFANDDGMIFIYGSNNKILDTYFSNNINEYRAGAIYINGDNNSIFNCEIVNCSAKSDGGAIYSIGNNSTLGNCIFVNCSSTSNGGAIYISGTDPIIANCNFVNCSAKNGGAINFNGNGTVIDSNFTNNHATFGGAMSNGTAINCTFNYNQANERGGAMMDGAAINCSFNYNQAYGGGAIYLSGDTYIVSNCTFNNNFGKSYGGAIMSIAINGIVSDCNFVNCYGSTTDDSSSMGGAIYWSGDNGIVSNCSFVNCYRTSSGHGSVVGGAINWSGAEGIISDCSFINCSTFSPGSRVKYSPSYSNGGAILLAGTSDIVSNCSFINCYSNSSGYSGSKGGAILSSDNGVISDCSFINCSIYSSGSTSEEGGAVWMGSDNNIYNCNFVNCSIFDSSSSFSYGGAIYCSGNNGNIKNSTFDNCHISSCEYAFGGAIYWSGDIGSTSNCSFINCSISGTNSHSSYGGAICWESTNGNISNCTFVDNYARNGGAVNMFTSSKHCIINNSIFINNNATVGKSITWDGEYGLINNTTFYPDYNNIYTSQESLEIIKRNVLFVSEDISFTFMNPSEFIVLIKNDNQNILSNKNIRIIIKNNNTIYNTFDITSDEKGSITLCDELKNLTIGIWDVSIIFDGDDNYYINNVTTHIIVNPPTSSLTIEDLNTTVSHEVNLVANVNSIFIINEGIVTFFDDLTQIGEAEVIDGVATLTYTPNTEGEHNITAIFNSNNYLSSSNSCKLLVDSASVVVLVDNGTVGFNSTFVANVKGLYSIINEGFVSFYIGDQYLGKVLVINGSANFTYMPLEANSYIVKVIYGDSNRFLDDENTASYTVNKADTQVVISDFTGTVGYELTLSVNVISSNNLTINEGVVSFFDGEINIGEADVIDGVATITYTPTKYGKFNISAIYNDSSNYLKSNNTSEININKANVEVTIEEIDDVYYSVPSKFTVKVFSNSKEVNEGIVKFYINNNEVGYSNVNNGVSTFEYICPNSGTFDITVIFEESENYLSNNTQVNLTINKMPTFIRCESETIGDEKLFSIELVDINGKGISNESVDLILTKSTGEIKLLNNISDSEGIITYSLSDLSGGVWSISCNHKESENYLASSDANKFVLIKIKTSTVINQMDEVYINEEVNLSFDIYDEFGNIIKVGIAHLFINDEIIGEFNFDNHSVTDYLNNRTIDFSQDSNLFLEYVALINGSYSFKVLFGGNDLYESSNQTITFDANAPQPIDEKDIDVPSLDDATGGTVSVKLPSDATGTITLNINGKNYTFDVVNGVANVILPDLVDGAYSYSIIYSGDSKYSSFAKNGNLTIKRITDIIVSNVNTVYNGGKYLVATLKDINGNIISGVKLTVVLNGKTYTPTTDANGQVRLSTNGLAPKVYIATITFAGNTNLAKSTRSAKVIVTKATPKITAKAKTFKRTLKTKKYSITLKTNQNKVMKSTKVYIKVNKKTYAAKTNSKGVATFKITKLTKKGRYAAIVTYKGNAYYNKLTKKVKITVK